jgi:hypothetical protein
LRRSKKQQFGQEKPVSRGKQRLRERISQTGDTDKMPKVAGTGSRDIAQADQEVSSPFD